MKFKKYAASAWELMRKSLFCYTHIKKIKNVNSPFGY
jgi:hypothetical protein